MIQSLSIIGNDPIIGHWLVVGVKVISHWSLVIGDDLRLTQRSTTQEFTALDSVKTWQSIPVTPSSA